MILEVQGISFSYASRAVLEKIKFSLACGEVLAILGTNGTGKSTLLKCLNRILQPQAGSIYLQNNLLAEMKRNVIAQKIGYVEQHQGYTDCTVFDAILLGRKPYIKWDVSAADIAIVEKIIDLLHLRPYMLRYLDELSGGEQQKVIIARALAQEPAILLLDEPTSSLDLNNQLEVLRIIKQVTRQQKVAAIVTLHDINLALRFADKFIMLKDHKIFAAGTEAVLSAENIEAVYSVPVAIEKFKNKRVVIPL